MSPSTKKYGVIANFPAEEREKIWQELVAKSGGKCQLCEDTLDTSSDDVILEHKDNKGKTEIQNLYLAHRSCNSLKKDLPYSEAKRMIKFKHFCENKGYRLSFDDILDKYLPKDKRKAVRLRLNGDKATLIFSSDDKVECNVLVDPATSTQYLFADVPVKYVNNDVDVQPRSINWGHAWLMALDFQKHPVHEPSSCRINLDKNNTGKLLQFDGQHKTTAQILLGRARVPMKIYVNPDLTMIKDLIITIQNRIRKMPLAPAIHLAKMQDVYYQKLLFTGAATEKAFVETYLTRDRPNAKKEVFSSIYKIILSNTGNKFTKYIQPEGTRAGKYPLSMNLTINYILKSLVCQDLQVVQMGSPQDFRLSECANVVFVLNILAYELLEDGKWPLNNAPEESSSDFLKAVRFFKSGAVRYWANILRSAIVSRLNLIEEEDKSRMLLRPLTDDQKKLVLNVVQRLANHPIWTDEDGTIDSKLNENKKETSEKLFKGPPDGYKFPLNVGYLLDIK